MVWICISYMIGFVLHNQASLLRKYPFCCNIIDPSRMYLNHDYDPTNKALGSFNGIDWLFKSFPFMLNIYDFGIHLVGNTQDYIYG